MGKRNGVQRRGTTNGNDRGSARDRARRRAWLVRAWPARELFQFMDKTCAFKCISRPLVGLTRCYACGKLLDEETVTVDRIIPGCRGGKYTRDNIRPACMTCNSHDGAPIRGTSDVTV